MGVGRALGALAVVVAALAGGSDRAAAGCNPNLAWQDRYPAWQGSAIVFQREEVGCAGPEVVATVRPDGSRLDAVASGVTPAVSSAGKLAWTNAFGRIVVDGVDVTGGENPAWSPSGDRLAFLRGKALWVRELESGAERRLADAAVFAPFSEAHVTTPSWSPDGREIAFVGPGLKISVAAADRSGVRRLTSGLDRQVAPAWSPDGARIAFMSDRGDSFDIWTIHPDATGTARLTRDDADESLPAWSADGRRIAFLRATGRGYGKAALVVMGGEGGFERTIGADAHGFSQPAWSPEGTRIVFSAGRECGRWGLYVVEAASGAQQRITNRCRFTGSPHHDALRGTPFLDFLDGRGGNDVIRGLAGPDRILGGSGRDTLNGGDGADSIYARDGERDMVLGGRGRDSAQIDRGLDRVSGVERLLP